MEYPFQALTGTDRFSSRSVNKTTRWLFVLLALTSGSLFGAEIKSAASGYWTAASTWAGGTVPGDGDTVLIGNGHTIAIPVGESVIVGNAASPSTYAIAAAGRGGTGVLNVDGTLIVKGNVKQGNATWTFSGGSVLEFDSSTSLTWQIGDGGGQMNSYLFLNGSSGSRVTVRSKAGRANGRFTNASVQTGKVRFRYADLTRIGDASNPAVYMAGQNSSSSEVYVTTSVFDTCGWIRFGGTENGMTLRVNDNLWKNSVGARNAEFDFGGAHTAGTREILRNDFDLPVRVTGGQNVDFRLNTLQGTSANGEVDLTGTASQQPGWSDLLVWRKRGAHSNWPGGDNRISRVYVVFEYSGNNPHGFAQIQNNASYDAWIFDGSGLLYGNRTEGDIIFNRARSDGGVAVTDVRNCILLPTGDGYNMAKLVNPLNAPSNGSTVDIRISNNTVFSGGTGETGVFNWGETWSGQSGGGTLFKSNLSVRAPSHTVGGLLINRTNTGPVQDFFAPAGVTNNACWNCANGTDGYGYNTTVRTPTATAFTTPPPAPLNADPRFVDPTRNIKTWDASLGGPGTIQHAFGEIRKRNDPTQIYDARYSIGALYNWVRAGYLPQNPRFWGAAHDGGTIGAVSADSLRRAAGAAAAIQ